MPDLQPHLHHPVFKFTASKHSSQRKRSKSHRPTEHRHPSRGWCLSVPPCALCPSTAPGLFTLLWRQKLLSSARLTVPFPSPCTALLPPWVWGCSQSRVISAKKLYITGISSDSLPLVWLDNFCYKSKSKASKSAAIIIFLSYNMYSCDTTVLSADRGNLGPCSTGCCRM